MLPASFHVFPSCLLSGESPLPPSRQPKTGHRSSSSGPRMRGFKKPHLISCNVSLPVLSAELANQRVTMSVCRKEVHVLMPLRCNLCFASQEQAQQPLSEVGFLRAFASFALQHFATLRRSLQIFGHMGLQVQDLGVKASELAGKAASTS